MNKQIIQEAAEWFVELNAGEADQRVRQKFDEWLRASPEHLKAFFALVPTWEEAVAVQSPESRSAEELVSWARGADKVVAFEPANVAMGSATDMQKERGSTRAHRSRSAAGLRARYLAAASVAILGVAVTLFGLWYSYSPPVFSTQIGEQRSVTLADGSIVELNARSRIRVRFTTDVRTVELLEGQAIFRVSKDLQRPFVVASDATRIRAVGTEFDVHRRNSGTTVTVLEGRVAVWPGTSDATSADRTPLTRSPEGQSSGRKLETKPGETLLAVGQQLIIERNTPATPTHADVASVTAWTRRQLVFEKAQLRDVAEEFNRYTARPLKLDDPRLESLIVSGVFSSTDPGSLLRFLRAQPDIDVVESGNEIHIRVKKVPGE